MSKPNIVLIGHVCIDHNKSEHATYTGWGSSVLYMGQYYRKHSDASPVIVSSFGPDMLEYFPDDVITLPAEPNQTTTLIYENVTVTGKRTQSCHNLVSAVPPSITPEVFDAVKRADIIVVATLLPNYSAEYLHELLGHAGPDSLKVLCPQGYFRHISEEGRVGPRDFIEAPEIIPDFDLVMYSEEDYPEAFKLAEQWKQSSPKTNIVVTQGANGASIIEADNITQIPTHPIPLEEIVDSVGCGDTFAATVTYSYYQTRDLQTAILDGHKAAAQKLLAVITVK